MSETLVSDTLTTLDLLLVGAAILEPILVGLVVFVLGRRLPVTGAAPVVVVVMWALATGLGAYAWGGALGMVKPVVLGEQALNVLQLWLLGWICISASAILALGFWREWRREDRDEDAGDGDVVRWR